MSIVYELFAVLKSNPINQVSFIGLSDVEVMRRFINSLDNYDRKDWDITIYGKEDPELYEVMKCNKSNCIDNCTCL